MTYPVTGPGTHSFLWQYVKDDDEEYDGEDSGFVDCVGWTGEPPSQESVTWETATYKYDPTDRRIEKDIDGDTTTYVYDGDDVIAEYDDGVLARKFIHSPRVDEVVCMIDVADSSAVYYYHYDGSGSVVALSDSYGTSRQSYEYGAYGRVRAEDIDFKANPYMYTGRRFDYETGLYYYRARYYNPYIGRFLQTDPIGYGAGMNLYRYCMNNPINMSDPLGLIENIPPIDQLLNPLYTLTHVIDIKWTTDAVGYPWCDDDGWLQWLNWAQITLTVDVNSLSDTFLGAPNITYDSGTRYGYDVTQDIVGPISFYNSNGIECYMYKVNFKWSGKIARITEIPHLPKLEKILNYLIPTSVMESKADIVVCANGIVKSTVTPSTNKWADDWEQKVYLSITSGFSLIIFGSRNLMKIKIIISTVIVYLVGGYFAPFDLLAFLVFGIESVFLCCISLLILSRRKFVKSSSNSMHTLVCILVCIISVLSVYWINSDGYKYLYPTSSGMSHSSSSSSTTSSNIRFGNLWGGYSFDKNIVCAIFSVDHPIDTEYNSPINNWKLVFSNGNSVEFNIIRNETVWVDKKHRVTFLGELLSKEDLSFINSLSYDKDLRISSPDELLNTINKLKTEHKSSADTS